MPKLSALSKRSLTRLIPPAWRPAFRIKLSFLSKLSFTRSFPPAWRPAFHIKPSALSKLSFTRLIPPAWRPAFLTRSMPPAWRPAFLTRPAFLIKLSALSKLSFIIPLMCLLGFGAASAQGHRTSLMKGAKTQQTSAKGGAALPTEIFSDDADLVEANGGVRDINNPGSGMQKVFRGKYHTVDENGDTVLVIIFNEITVFPEMKFKNKQQEEFYWRTVRDVKKTLPYAKLICETLVETYEYLETFPTQKERDRYMKQMESAVFEQYKPVLRKFTKGQANMLVKLIQRQTNQSGYDILKAFLGSFRATFWQGFGKLFGVSLKGKYQPDKDSNDAIIERVCVMVEQGQL